MACLIILFNWFPLSFSGLIVALWQSSYFFIPFIAEFFDLETADNYLAGCILVGALYVGFAIICHFYFHHHPSHIGIRVQTNAKSSGSGANFFVDILQYGNTDPNKRQTAS